VRYLRALKGIKTNPGGTRDFTINLRDQLSFLLLSVFLVTLLVGCSDVTSTVAGTAPNITNVAPNPAAVGTSVTISGMNFGATQGTSTVTFNGTVAAPTNWSATSIVTPVPVGAKTGNVVVTVGGQASNGFVFTVSAPGPNISNVAPNPAAVGTSVTITGMNFGATQGTSTVTFNGTVAAPTNWSATSIVTPVPVGATSGPVVVTVGGQASNGFSFTVGSGAQPGDSVTWHYDNSRSGLNPNETVLTTANVNSTTFGKVGEFTVDGQIDGEILYLKQIPIPGQGLKNVIYFATEHDTVYAVDADSISGSTATILWSKSLVPAGEAPAVPVQCGNINPNGVTATPVIDRARNAIYVVAMTMNSTTTTTQFDRIHALDLTNGDELFGGPTTIEATYPGTGGNIENGVVTFDAKLHHDRAALLETGNNIYTVWSGQSGDCGLYSAWVISYSSDTLTQTAAIDLFPTGHGAGIWNGGGGPSADAAGSVYVVTGNGFGVGSPIPANDYPNSVVRLTNSGTLQVADYWTQFNAIALDNSDTDLGSASVLLLPDLVDNASVTHHLAVAAGKDGSMYVLNRDDLGQFSASQNNIVQTIAINGAAGTENFSTPVFFNNTVYISPSNQTLKAFAISNALLSTSATMQTAQSFGRTVPTISSNGNSNGIVWALAGSVLYAYDATDLSNLLYTSNQAAANRDHIAAVGGSFITPMVGDGKVYIGTGTTVAVFGLLH